MRARIETREEYDYVAKKGLFEPLVDDRFEIDHNEDRDTKENSEATMPRK